MSTITPGQAHASVGTPTPQAATFGPLPDDEGQNFVVPPGTYSVTVTAVGGSGGSGTAGNFGAGGPGGSGAAVTEILPVTPGQTLGIFVGHSAKAYVPGSFGGTVAMDCGGGDGGFYRGGGAGGTGGQASFVFTSDAGSSTAYLPPGRHAKTGVYVQVFAGGGGGGGGGGSIVGYAGGPGGAGGRPGGHGAGLGAGAGGAGQAAGSSQIWRGQNGVAPVLQTGAGCSGGGGGGWNGAALGGGLAGTPGDGSGGGGGGGAGGASYASRPDAQFGFASDLADGHVRLTWTPTGSGVTANPATVDFGGQRVGTTATRTVTVTNSGTTPWTPGANMGSRPGIGLVAGGTCDGATLAPGASCTTIVAYTPPGLGLYAGSITIQSNLPGPPMVIPVSGSGV
jgi:hypothetical protein